MMLVEDSRNDVDFNVIKNDVEYLRAQVFFERIAREEAEEEAKKWQRRCVDAKLSNVHSQLNVSQELHQLSQVPKAAFAHISNNNTEHINNITNNSDRNINIDAEDTCEQLIQKLVELIKKDASLHNLPKVSIENTDNAKHYELSKVNRYITNLHDCIRQLEKIALACKESEGQRKCEGELFRPELDATAEITELCDGDTNNLSCQKTKKSVHFDVSTKEIVDHVRHNKKLLLKSGVVVAAAHLFCFGIAAVVGKMLHLKYSNKKENNDDQVTFV